MRRLIVSSLTLPCLRRLALDIRLAGDLVGAGGGGGEEDGDATGGVGCCTSEAIVRWAPVTSVVVEGGGGGGVALLITGVEVSTDEVLKAIRING